ncbi:hypothetical protein PCH_Pc22g25810 [Penicillium rubens Wisconsin 54-1255]|uniref:Uncharacterized protein n=1 Tax=Penicillium rubens (strain ATCC 28089 / DSM 1075 / NRRL 1951 / Wisconsin 54-1255) TaxID=500485 RepID=B6HSZ4_PENRW|nr:hypothetical protein PCH_Pc22g25810 [Penicillium rubens Wisconsin 54-1255]
MIEVRWGPTSHLEPELVKTLSTIAAQDRLYGRVQEVLQPDGFCGAVTDFNPTFTKSAGFEIKLNNFRSKREEKTLLIACSSVYVRTTCSRSLAHVDELSNAERKRDQGTVSDVVLESCALSIVRPSSILTIDLKLTWPFVS